MPMTLGASSSLHSSAKEKGRALLHSTGSTIRGDDNGLGETFED